MPRLAKALAFVAVVAFVGGCGNGEQNDYVDEVNQLQNELVANVSDAVAGSTPSTPKDAARIAGDLQQVFEDGAGSFAEVDPPEEVADLHQQLVDQIQAIADQVGEAEDAFTSGSAQQASEAAIALQNAGNEAQTDLDTIIDQINEQLQS